LSIGFTALGPRKKIVHALSELRKGSCAHAVETHSDMHACSEPQRRSANAVEMHSDASEGTVDETKKLAANKLITDYFPGTATDRKKVNASVGLSGMGKRCSKSGGKRAVMKNDIKNGKRMDVPLWCCIPGTPFRVVSGLSSYYKYCHFHFSPLHI
jgi:DNA cross-link repair 1A protein